MSVKVGKPLETPCTRNDRSSGFLPLELQSTGNTLEEICEDWYIGEDMGVVGIMS